MPESFFEYATACPDEDIPILRELMSYDALCPQCNVLVRKPLGELFPANLPSPLHWSRQIEWPWIIRNAELKDTDAVLDIGGGWSVLKYALAKRCCVLISVDNDLKSIDIAEQSTKHLGFSNIRNFEKDARKLEIKDAVYDVVVMCSVLEHIPDKHLDCIKEAVRVLRPGGIFLLTMDMRLNDQIGENFYVDAKIVQSIINYLGIKKKLGEMQIFGKVGPTDVACVMIKYVKPL